MLFILLTVLCLSLRLTSENPLRPRYFSVDVGLHVVLPCEAKDSDDVLWEFEKEGSNQPTELASYGKPINGHAKRFTLVPSSRGLHNLMINKTQLSDAGMYICIEENGASTKHYVFLIVNGNGIKPRPVVVDERSLAMLPCEPEIKADVMWEFEDTSSHSARELASWGAIISGHEDRFTLSSSANGTHYLQINKTGSRDAGLYICTEDNGAGMKHYVLLKVIGAATNGNKSTGYDLEKSGNATWKPFAGNGSEPTTDNASSLVPFITTTILSSLIAAIAVVALLLMTVLKIKRRSGRRQGHRSSKDILFCRLPNELYEMILKKSTTSLYTQLQKQSAEGDIDVLAVKSICSVNSKWNELIATREFNMKQLKQTFSRLSSPCPRRLPEPKILVEENNDVNSFTVLGKYIYIVRGSLRRELQVFDGDDYTELQMQALGDNMIHPTGLVGSQANDCLYLGDSVSRCIWTLTTWKSGNACELNTFYSVPAAGHSVKSIAATDDGRLIVLIAVEEFSGKTWRGKLDILDRYGKCLGRIRILEDIVNPSCVAFTQNNMFAISGLKKIWLLGEIDCKLSELSTFSEGIEFPSSIRYNPDYGTLFVADSGSGKVLLLAIRGEKLVFRKQVKKWEECRTIQANRSFVVNERVPSIERVPLIGGDDEDHATVNDRFEVRNVPTVRFDVGCPDDGVQQQVSFNGSDIDVPQTVTRDLERYQKRPVRVVSDSDKLIVGLNSGEILAYRLH